VSELRILKGRCGNCGSKLQAKSHSLEKVVACPKCKAQVMLSAAVALSQESSPSSSRLFSFNCPNCGSASEFAYSLIGKAVTCPECEQQILLPTPGSNQGPPGRKKRIDYAEKERCPKCGSTDFRAMTAVESQEFYGAGQAFILSRPRICKNCGHGYEAQPSSGGCYAMMSFAALGVVVGAGICILGVVLPFLAFGDDHVQLSALWVIGRSAIAVLFGVSMVSGSARVFWKCRAYLRAGENELKPLTPSLTKTVAPADPLSGDTATGLKSDGRPTMPKTSRVGAIALLGLGVGAVAVNLLLLAFMNQFFPVVLAFCPGFFLLGVAGLWKPALANFLLVATGLTTGKETDYPASVRVIGSVLFFVGFAVGLAIAIAISG
jgi:DNA-directed RNA polymerase subunit RPC12/RpoP